MNTNLTNRTGARRGRGLLARQKQAWASGGPTPVLLVGAVVRSIGLLARGRVRLPRSRVGQILTMQDGEHWRIFRQLRLDTTPTDAPAGEFRVCFTTRMPAQVNIAFSWLPIVLFMGLPGFVSKTWLVNDATGAFAGIYQWRTYQDAQRYAGSAALRFMTNRSVPGSVSYAVGTPPSDRLEKPWPPATPQRPTEPTSAA